MSTIYLGSCDVGKTPLDRRKFLAAYHKDGLTSKAVSFRDDDRTTKLKLWKPKNQKEFSP